MADLLFDYEHHPNRLRETSTAVLSTSTTFYVAVNYGK
jgi:hypothetical protein